MLKPVLSKKKTSPKSYQNLRVNYSVYLNNICAYDVYTISPLEIRANLAGKLGYGGGLQHAYVKLKRRLQGPQNLGIVFFCSKK